MKNEKSVDSMDQIDQLQESRMETAKRNIETAKRSLEQREDLVGETYRTIRDNPRTSAAIGAGVVAAAGAGAFLLNRKHKVGTAFGHASTSSEIEREVQQNNRENLEMAKQGKKTTA